MPLVKENIYTVDDIYKLPDGARAELIDGQMYDMAPPLRRIGLLNCFLKQPLHGLHGSQMKL